MKKASLIVGNGTAIELVKQVLAILPRLQMTIHIFESDTVMKYGFEGARVKVYEFNEDLPGYMKGLEDNLEDEDIIFGFENSSFSSFQGIRAAKGNNKPFCCIVSEYLPYFYQKYKNISAIQYDINLNSDIFLALSAASRDMLLLQNVSEDRVIETHLCADVSDFPDVKRKKFRDYCSFSQTDKVVLSFCDLEESSSVTSVLRSFAMLRNYLGSDFENYRLLLIGRGSLAKTLKYMSFDYKLGDKVAFIHQDVAPFYEDIFYGCDYYIALPNVETELHPKFNHHLVKAASVGLVPVTFSCSVESSVVSNGGVVVNDRSFHGIAKELSNYILNSETPLISISDRMFQAYAESKLTIDGSLAGIFQFYDGQEHGMSDGTFLEIVANHISIGQKTDATMLIEEKLISPKCSSFVKAECFRLKGDMLFSDGKFDDAVKAFSSCIEIDHKNFAAYRGLGYVSYQSHAHDDAITFFKKALSNNENDDQSLLGIGLIHRRLGLTAESCYWLKKTLTVNDQNQRAIVALSQSCLDTDKLRLATAVMEDAIENFGENPNFLRALGKLYIKQGKSKQGNELLEKAELK